ncbi:hypothetical protein, partial [Pseudomonas syringae]
ILAEGRGSELVREDGRSENAFSENIPALSRTSSLLRPPGRSEIVQALQLQELPEPHAHAEYPSLRTSPLLILAGGRGSELVREDGRSENAFSENVPALSLLRPPGRSEIVQALQYLCLTMGAEHSFAWQVLLAGHKKTRISAGFFNAQSTQLTLASSSPRA